MIGVALFRMVIIKSELTFNKFNYCLKIFSKQCNPITYPWLGCSQHCTLGMTLGYRWFVVMIVFTRKMGTNSNQFLLVACFISLERDLQ